MCIVNRLTSKIDIKYTKLYKIVQQYPQIISLNPRFSDNPHFSKFCSIITSSNSFFSSCVKTISDEGIGCMGGTHFSVLTFFKGDAKGDWVLS